MGAIAEGLVAYAQPLLDQTDGSEAQLNHAFALSQLCFNLALLPEEKREAAISDARATLKMDDAEFDEFRRSVLVPMIERHHEMFPRMHSRAAGNPWQTAVSQRLQPTTSAPGEKYPGTDRYAPCPCNSGQKYKFCCGVKRR